MKVQSYSWAEWPQVIERWCDLHSISPHRSFFTSSLWVSTWLEVFGAKLKPAIYVLESQGKPRAAWLLVRRNEAWHYIPIRRVHLGTAGEEQGDSLFIEYNGFVCDPAFQEEAIAALWKTVNESSWDEFLCSGVEPEVGRAIMGDRLASANILLAFGIDLDAVRGQGEYIEHLSYNSRQQLRKSFRFYGRRGTLAVDLAQNTEEALGMLDELAALHQETWHKRGESGAFSSPVFRGFHRRLISASFESVQLLRARAGSETIGLLYSFISAGTLHTYQSGFRYEDGNNNARPGLVVTALAIEYCRSQTSLKYFDLMAGTGRYKNSLSTVQKELGWYTARAYTARNMVCHLARRAALGLGGLVRHKQTVAQS